MNPLSLAIRPILVWRHNEFDVRPRDTVEVRPEASLVSECDERALLSSALRR